jgi:hypothetical protein
MGFERPPTIPPEIEFVKKDLEKAPDFTYSFDDLQTVARERDIALSAQDVEPFHEVNADDLSKKVDRYFERVLQQDRLDTLASHQPTKQEQVEFKEHNDKNRQKLHNRLIESLDILTRHLGQTYAAWYKTELRNDRHLIALWAIREGYNRWLEKELKTDE